MTIMPDGSYEVKSFATDTERNNVAAYGVFSGRRDYLVLDPASFGRVGPREGLVLQFQ